MNTIEDRLKAATRAAADTVAYGSAPPLNLQPAGDRARPRTRRLPTWIAPLMAGIAVLAIAVPAAIWHDDRATRPVTFSGRVSANPPPYFITLNYDGQFKPRKIERTYAIVGLTSTGKPIVTVPTPASYNAFVGVSAAADDRRFVLVAENLTRPDELYATRMRFYELTVRPNGSQPAAKLSPLPIPALPTGPSSDLDEIALSPDASKLAITEGAPGGDTKPTVRVYDTSTGRERTWYVPASEVATPDATQSIQSPSWEANGRYLAFDVSTREPSGKMCLDCVRLLDTATQGGNLLDHSRLLVQPPGQDPAGNLSIQWMSSLITPDGRHILRSAIVPRQITHKTLAYTGWTYEYGTGSGALSGSTAAGPGSYWYLLWSSSDGRSYIAATLARGAGPGFLAAVRYVNGHWRPVRLPPQTLTVAW